MAYTVTYNYFRVGTIPVKDYPVACFVALMLLKDMAYYWNHRVLHEYHLLWASHSVHHSGEDYNLSTGLRQGALQHILSIPFMLPMAVMGFPPAAYGAHAQLNTMYQFWVHTELVNRMPFGLEYIVNTPMAHRMHHRPPGNCNYVSFKCAPSHPVRYGDRNLLAGTGVVALVWWPGVWGRRHRATKQPTSACAHERRCPFL